MASLGMSGPFELTDDSIDNEVTKKSPGNYALGYTNKEDSFIVQYVGRSDTDLNKRLHQHAGEGYDEFKYSYATSPKAAFEKECSNYHDFGGSDKLKNDVHPRRPDNSGWKCPRCRIFD